MEEKIQCSEKIRNLDMFMDQTLSWDYHNKTITNCCFGILIAPGHIKHVLPTDLLPRIMDCVILSHVRYCIQTYGSASATSLKKYSKGHLNVAAWISSGCRKHDHISSVLNQLGWLNAEELVQYADLRILDKIIAIETPSPLASLIHFKH